MSMYDPAHPGQVLRESMEARNLSVQAAAETLGVSAALLSRILLERPALRLRWPLELNAPAGPTPTFG